jgi:uncharacterized SAM-binding protein YcdF (DUF218 family)
MRRRAGDRHAPAVDAVIVLGAALEAPGVGGPALRRRLRHGIAAFRELNARHLVLSGGVVVHHPAEAQVMRVLALDWGVPADRLVIEDRARNTFENALHCGRIMRAHGWRDVVVVTDGFHLTRALYCFRRLGFPARGRGVGRPGGTSRLRWAWLHLDDRLRLVRSAWLFLKGTHEPLPGLLDQRD